MAGGRVIALWGDLLAGVQDENRDALSSRLWIVVCCLVRGLRLATLEYDQFAPWEDDGLRLVEFTAASNPGR